MLYPKNKVAQQPQQLIPLSILLKVMMIYYLNSNRLVMVYPKNKVAQQLQLIPLSILLKVMMIYQLNSNRLIMLYLKNKVVQNQQPLKPKAGLVIQTPLMLMLLIYLML